VATKFSSRRHRRLGFQPLEERTMMAGDSGANILGGKVGVIVIDGDLHLNGDAAANNVAIAQVMQNGVPVNGNYVIAGLNGTTINGSTGYTATGVTRDFIINMGGGGDSLLLGPVPTLSHPSSDKFLVSRNLYVQMGACGVDTTFYANGITVGNNAVIDSGNSDTSHFYIRGNFYNDVNLTSDADNVYVSMWDGFVSHDLTMQALADSRFEQEYLLYKMNIGHNLNINSYRPADFAYVDINAVSVSNSLTIHASRSNDQVDLENVTAATLRIDADGGLAGTNNRVDLKGVGIYGTATLNGGDGNDRFDIQGTFVGLTVNGGAGNDTVLIHDSFIGPLTVTESSLNNQHDVVSVKNTYVGGNASVTTGSGSDTVTLDNASVYSRLTINTGNGADYITLTNCVADELFASLGGNNGDELDILGTSRFRRGTLDGGGGGSFLYIAKDVVFTEYYHHMNFYLSYWDK
jgi:hypothetical protein